MTKLQNPSDQYMSATFWLENLSLGPTCITNIILSSISGRSSSHHPVWVQARATAGVCQGSSLPIRVPLWDRHRPC